MGNKVDSFDVPVCNSFKAVLHNDQICYQVDIEKFRDEEMLEKQLYRNTKIFGKLTLVFTILS